jgi:hypothetical protein
MTDNISRKKHTGEQGNGGHFGSKQNTADELALAAAETQLISNFDLESGNILVGESSGTRITIEDASPSSSMPGFMIVETEFGCLYLDSEGESRIVTEEPDVTHGLEPYVTHDLASEIFEDNGRELSEFEVTRQAADRYKAMKQS